MKKSLRISAFVLVLVMLIGGIVSNAAVFYTYTYRIDGKAQTSPEIYRPYKQINSNYMGLGETPISNPTDIVVDNNGKVYIADPTNNRIVVLTKYWKLDYTITTFVNQFGNADALSGAKGLYVCDDGEIYVADTNNERVVVFDQEGKFLRGYPAPQSDVFEEGSSYTPIALSVDNSKRIYVVSSTATEGIISLNADGSFATFIGAQKVVASALQTLWRKFMTAEQRSQIQDTVPTPYNNITIDDKGFIYVTIQFTKEYEGVQQDATKAATSDYSPVKRLNASGTDIMRRNGFFGPSGEVDVKSALTSTYEGVATGVSTIVDVALGEEETWSIFDQKRSHIFTYDKNGNLLGVFGDKGTQLGNVIRGVGLAYQDLADDGLHYLLVLDADTNTIVVYERTEYGETLMSALRNTNQRKYDEATNDWQSILQRNNNYDTAYIGIGDALYREERWEDAMNYYKSASDVESYSNAFKMYRKDAVSELLLVIVAVIILFLVGVAKFFGFAGKHNKKTALKVGKKSFGDEIIYAFHVMFHPFDGFWDLKHEKRGSVKGASFWLAMVIIGFTYQSVGRSYIITSQSTVAYQSVLGQVVSVLVPFFLFVIANWCLTTLFEGEGSVKDIYIAVGYAIAPLSFLTIFSTICTNFVSQSEVKFIELIDGIAWVWVGLLLFFGILVTHDFSISKNIIMTVATIVVMMVIMFVLVLFSGLLIKMISFVSNIITEISYNM